MEVARNVFFGVAIVGEVYLDPQDWPSKINMAIEDLEKIRLEMLWPFHQRARKAAPARSPPPSPPATATPPPRNPLHLDSIEGRGNSASEGRTT